MIKIVKIKIVTLGFLFVFSFGFCKESDLNVVICAGQSNMVGARALKEGLPKNLQGIQEGNLFFNGKKWVSIGPGVTGKKGFGPEISFAERFSKKIRKPIGIVKYSVGGTNLAKQWSIKDKSSLYYKMIAHVKAAQKKKKINIIGVLWVQGEADARHKEMAEAYAENLKEFVKHIRLDLKAPNLIFVSGRVNPLKKRFKFVDIVREAQEKCKTSRYGFIDLDKLSKGSDKLHYDTKGIVEMGYLFADKFLKIKK